MKRSAFEDLTIDYLEGALTANSKAEYEAAMENDASLKEMHTQYVRVIEIHRAVASESYSASPGFANRVMTQIRNLEEESLLSRVSQYLQPYFSPFYLGTAAAVALLFVVTVTSPEFRRYFHPVMTEVPKDPYDSAPIVMRETAPVEIARFVSGGQRADVTPGAQSSRPSPIEELLNAVGHQYPQGSHEPIDITFEGVRSPTDHEKILFRISLSANDFARDFGAVAQDIRLDLLFEGSPVATIEPLAAPKEVIKNPVGKLLWATGREMVVKQQFTALGALTLKKGVSITPDTNLFDVVVNFKDAQTPELKREKISVKFSEVKENYSAATYPMQEIYKWLFAEEKFPGSVSNIDPQAFGEFGKQIQELVERGLPSILEGDPEGMKRYQEALSKMKVPNLLRPGTKHRLPKEIMDKYPRSSLRKMFGDAAVDPDGNPL